MLSVFLQTVLAKVAESLSGEEVNVYGLLYEVLEAELGPEGAEAIFTIFGDLQNGPPRNNCDSERSDGRPVLDSDPVEHRAHQERIKSVSSRGEDLGGSEDRRGLLEDRGTHDGTDRGDQTSNDAGSVKVRGGYKARIRDPPLGDPGP